VSYFWKVLDVYHKGGIDTFAINMFFRAVIQKLESREKLGFRVDDVKDELWDMAKPRNVYCITLEDLQNCGVGDVIISMLTDAKAFYEYD
jgi:serine/threonine-protein phosphatase 2A regulatory subunit B''